MKKLIACLLSLMMVFALCASAFADEGELVIYNAVYEEEGDGLCARFQELTGIKTSAVTLGGGDSTRPCNETV